MASAAIIGAWEITFGSNGHAMVMFNGRHVVDSPFTVSGDEITFTTLDNSLLFFIANLGVSGSIVFYDSLLPHIASRDEVDRVSTAGYALGYLGGGLLLALNLACIVVALSGVDF